MGRTVSVPVLWLVPVFLPMLVEARVSARHERRLRAMGALEPSGDVYGAMLIAYPATFLAMITEGALRGVTLTVAEGERWGIIGRNGAGKPAASPLVFASVQSGPVEIFLNAPEPAIAEYPAFKGRPIGGTLTLFTEVTAIARVYESLQARVKIVMPIEKKWYGVTEFAFEDPDGYLITYAERDPA